MTGRFRQADNGIVVEVGVDVEVLELVRLVSYVRVVVVGVGHVIENVTVDKLFSLSDFEIEPISADIIGIVAVVPVAIDRVADFQRVAAADHEDGRNAVTIFTIQQVVISIIMVNLEKGSDNFTSIFSN